MSESRPILFSGPMVRAIIEGRKTQTRRLVKPQPNAGVRQSALSKSGLEDGHGREIRPRIYVGDTLWVRETWTQDGRGKPEPGGHDAVFYRADFVGAVPWKGFWRPAIFMPRWASRLTLRVTGVRLQRLHVITEADAMAEGCTKVNDGCYVFRGTKSDLAGLGHSDAVMAYACLWDEINGPDSWDANPWVWAYTFEVTPGSDCGA